MSNIVNKNQKTFLMDIGNFIAGNESSTYRIAWFERELAA